MHPLISFHPAHIQITLRQGFFTAHNTSCSENSFLSGEDTGNLNVPSLSTPGLGLHQTRAVACRVWTRRPEVTSRFASTTTATSRWCNGVRGGHVAAGGVLRQVLLTQRWPTAQLAAVSTPQAARPTIRRRRCWNDRETSRFFVSLPDREDGLMYRDENRKH